MTSDKSIQCLSCLCVTKELEQKKQVNFNISCPPSSVYSPASILLAETFYQELASRLSEEEKKTRSNMASGNQVRNVTEN